MAFGGLRTLVCGSAALSIVGQLAAVAADGWSVGPVVVLVGMVLLVVVLLLEWRHENRDDRR